MLPCSSAPALHRRVVLVRVAFDEPSLPEGVEQSHAPAAAERVVAAAANFSLNVAKPLIAGDRGRPIAGQFAAGVGAHHFQKSE